MFRRKKEREGNRPRITGLKWFGGNRTRIEPGLAGLKKDLKELNNDSWLSLLTGVQQTFSYGFLENRAQNPNACYHYLNIHDKYLLHQTLILIPGRIIWFLRPPFETLHPSPSRLSGEREWSLKWSRDLICLGLSKKSNERNHYQFRTSLEN